MKVIRLSVLPLAALLLQGCITAYTLKPTATENQLASVRDGYEIVSSQKQHLVMVAPSTSVIRDSRDKFGIDVMVTNLGASPVRVSTKSITAKFNGAPLQSYTAEEVIAEIDRRMRIAAALSALGGSMQAASAQRQASRYRTSGYVSGYSSSGQYVSGHYYGYGRDSAAGLAAANAVNAQTDRNIQNIQATGAALVAKYSGKSFIDHTLNPGEWYGGTVYFDAISPSDPGGLLKVTVSLDGEDHDFTVNISPLK